MPRDRRERAIIIAGIGLAGIWLMFCNAMNDGIQWSFYFSLDDLAYSGRGFRKLFWGWGFIAAFTVLALVVLRAWFGKPLARRGQRGDT